MKTVRYTLPITRVPDNAVSAFLLITTPDDDEHIEFDIESKEVSFDVKEGVKVFATLEFVGEDDKSCVSYGSHFMASEKNTASGYFADMTVTVLPELPSQDDASSLVQLALSDEPEVLPPE